jgi:molybdopterin/thiamine biosynthesis adenylyltransferase
LVFRLSEINKDVRVQIHNENSFSGFSLVCLTETKSEDDINNINAQCRANRTPLVIGETFGVFGFVFNDFGDEFKVSNANKEDFMASYDNLGLQLNKTMQFVRSYTSWRLVLTMFD